MIYKIKRNKYKLLTYISAIISALGFIKIWAMAEASDLNLISMGFYDIGICIFALFIFGFFAYLAKCFYAKEKE